MTEEEKRLRRRAYEKKSRLKNKEKNREKYKLHSKKYYSANKERFATERKEHYENSKEQIRARNKEYRKRYVLPFYIVYCLPNEDPPYCGKTNQPKVRMRNHGYDYEGCGDVKNTEDWFILQVCETDREALDVELSYHKQGYAGLSK